MLLTCETLAQRLGVSPRTVRRLDLAGRLPAPVRIGRAVRWREEEIDRWLESGAPERREWAALRKKTAGAN